MTHPRMINCYLRGLKLIELETKAIFPQECADTRKSVQILTMGTGKDK